MPCHPGPCCRRRARTTPVCRAAARSTARDGAPCRRGGARSRGRRGSRTRYGGRRRRACRPGSRSPAYGGRGVLRPVGHRAYGHPGGGGAEEGHRLVGGPETADVGRADGAGQGWRLSTGTARGARGAEPARPTPGRSRAAAPLREPPPPPRANARAPSRTRGANAVRGRGAGGTSGRSPGPGRPLRACQPLRMARASLAVSVGVLPTLTPAASRASFFAWAVPEEPETMAPAWPMVLPSGAVKPAT